MKISNLPLLTILMIIPWSFHALQGQNSSTRYLDVGNLEDYSHYQTWCIFQDSRDFIWVGTLSGMDRWDGQQLKSYVHSPFDSLSFPPTGILSMAEDSSNRLWLGTNKLGLMRFDLESELVSRVENPGYPDSCSILSMIYDPDGFIWLGTNHGLYSYYPDQDSFKYHQLEDPDLKLHWEYIRDTIQKIDPSHMYDVYQNQDTATENRGSWINIVSMETDTNDVMWVAAHEGLYYFNKENDVLLPQKFSNQRIYCPTDLRMDEDGMIWVFQGGSEIWMFNPYTKEIQSCGPFWNSPVMAFGTGAILPDANGKVYFGMARGLWQYDKLTGSSTSIDEAFEWITDILKDKQGNLIIGTWEGIKILDRQGSKIRMLAKEYLNFGYHTDIIRDSQDYWLATRSNGVLKIDQNSGQKTYYKAGDGSGGLSSNFVSRLYKDKKDRFWATTDKGVHLYDPVKDSFGASSVGSGRYSAMDREGNFWLIRKDHILHFDPEGKKTTRYPLIRALRYEDFNDDFGLIRDTLGYLWFGHMGTNGLYRIEPETGTWIHYQHNEKDHNSLLNNNIHRILYDSSYRIWISTQKGISRIIQMPDNGPIQCRNYTVEDGLMSNHTFGLAEDLAGNIWIGTSVGISVLKKNSGLENFTSAHGLPEIALIWFIESDSHGKMYAGVLDIAEFPADFIEDNRHIPPIVFTDFKLHGESLMPGEKSPLKKSIYFENRIDLSYRENFIRFEFAALNYTHSEKNKYRYYMDGIDVDTVEANHQNFAEYTDLAPGKYTFWVSGSNNTGLWNPEGRTISVRIYPPWYRSQLAFGIYIILLAGLLMAYIRLRTSRLRNEKIALENEVQKRTAEIQKKNMQITEMEQLKTRFFTDVSHEIRTPLSLIDGPLDLMITRKQRDKEEREWLSMIKRNSSRLRELVNQLLDISRLDSGHMKLVLELDDVLKHLRVHVNGYLSLAESRNIIYKVDIPSGESIHWFDREKITRIVTNLLTNAFKFTPEYAAVTCRLKLLKGKKDHTPVLLRVIVADTGPGIPPEQHEKIFQRFYKIQEEQIEEKGGTGIGLSLSKDLLEMMQGDIALKSRVGVGSVFMVSIPLGKDHLKEKEYILKKEVKDVLQGSTLDTSPELKDSLLPGAKRDEQILIVEDNSDLRAFIGENLDPIYHVCTAKDGIEGMSEAVSKVPDLIITDVLMPGMNGMELCKKIKNDERTSHIPVIMLTAKATGDDKIEGYETGADDYIFKPFSMEELQARIVNLLVQRERLRKKYSRMIGLDWGEITVTNLDEKFLQKVTGTISENLHDFNFDVSVLQDKMAMSRSNLFKKLKALTGESPVHLIRLMRLKLAALMIEQGKGSITEILMSVGFSNPSYFAKCFKQYFGVTPKAYQKSHASAN